MGKDLLTEEKIKRSARDVFYRKGYAATRTIDIAINAGVNRSLIHYYFRSKSLLFEIVMKESIMELTAITEDIINDPNTDMSKKIDLIVSSYCNFLTKNPNIPFFILSEIQSGSNHNLDSILNSLNECLSNSLFFKQLEDYIKRQNLKRPISAYHVFISIISSCIFPFLSSKFFMRLVNLDEIDIIDYLITEQKESNNYQIKKSLNGAAT